MSLHHILLDLTKVTWRMLIPTLLGAGLGYGLGKIFGGVPIFFLAFSAAGLIIGIRSALSLINNKDKE